AANVGVPLSSLWRLCKRVGVRRHTRWVKPNVTDKQRVYRVGLDLGHLHRRGGSGGLVGDMFDWVHVDEKWAYLVKDGEKSSCNWMRRFPCPRGRRRSDSTLKMMFLAAVARPRKLSNGVWFDGNIGIWLVVDVSKKSRARGDPVLTPVTVNGEKFKSSHPRHHGQDA
ncbi:unnamed protein product, partial [Discosporangium mesarthrocarpum]